MASTSAPRRRAGERTGGGALGAFTVGEDWCEHSLAVALRGRQIRTGTPTRPSIATSASPGQTHARGTAAGCAPSLQGQPQRQVPEPVLVVGHQVRQRQQHVHAHAQQRREHRHHHGRRVAREPARPTRRTRGTRAEGVRRRPRHPRQHAERRSTTLPSSPRPPKQVARTRRHPAAERERDQEQHAARDGEPDAPGRRACPRRAACRDGRGRRPACGRRRRCASPSRPGRRAR